MFAPRNRRSRRIAAAGLPPALEYLEPRRLLSVGYIHTTAPLLSVGPSQISASAQTAVFDESEGTDLVQPTGQVAIYNNATGQWSQGALSVVRNTADIGVDGKFLFAGGEVGSAMTALVDIYDSASGLWSTANLSQPRDPGNPVALGDTAIFAGGDTAAGLSDVVDFYNAATGQWSAGTLPYAADIVASAAVAGKALFVADDASVFIYDAAAQTWSTARLSVARALVAVATLGDRVFIAGGQDLRTGRFSDVVDVYDARRGTWSVTHLPEPCSCDFVPATAVGGRFVFGTGPDGFSSPSAASAYIYDAATRRWSSLTFSPDGNDPCPGRLGDDLFLAGGADGVAFWYQLSRRVAVLDTATGQWSYDRLAFANTNMSAAELDGAVIFAGYGSGAAEIFSDPSLTGTVAAPKQAQVAVALRDTGASALPAGASLGVFASADGAIDAGAVLLGSLRLSGPLAAGASLDASVPLSAGVSLPPGRYRLIAAVGGLHDWLPFATAARPLTVATAPTSPAEHPLLAPAALPAASAFSLRQHAPADWAILASNADITL